MRRDSAETVYVFCTSVASAADVQRLQPLLCQLLHPSDRWNFDLDDRDNILRVVSKTIMPSAVITLLHSAGYVCQELEDVLTS